MNSRRWAAAMGVVIVLLFGALCLLSTRPLDAGMDAFTDMNILLSGENFATRGFLKMHLLPMHMVGGIDPDRAGAYTYYTHYPPLPNLFNGILQRLGVQSLLAARILCAAFMVAGAAFTAAAFARVFGLPASVLGLLFLGTTGCFLGLGTSLHHPFNFLFLGLFLLVFLRAIHEDAVGRARWMIAWTALFLGALASFEFILWAQSFAWLYAIGVRRYRLHRRALLVLATAPVLAVALHFLQVVWAIGWQEAWADGLGFRQIRGGLEGLAVRLHCWLQLPVTLFGYAVRLLAGWPALIGLLLAVLVVVLRTRVSPALARSRRTRALWIALAGASCTWYLAMPYHTSRHPHTSGQLLPLVVALAGVGVSQMVERACDARRRPYSRVLAVGVILLLFAGQSRIVRAALSAGRDPIYGVAKAIGPDAFSPRTAVLSNAGSTHFAYFVRRPWWLVPYPIAVPPIRFPDALPRLQGELEDGWKIRYYLFASWGYPDALALLAQTCPGRKLSVADTADFLILFDIEALHLPPDRRPALDPDVVERQLRGDYPRWEFPEFQERMAEWMRG